LPICDLDLHLSFRVLRVPRSASALLKFPNTVFPV
jgi:hypothetical protein